MCKFSKTVDPRVALCFGVFALPGRTGRARALAGQRASPQSGERPRVRSQRTVALLEGVFGARVPAMHRAPAARVLRLPPVPPIDGLGDSASVCPSCASARRQHARKQDSRQRDRAPSPAPCPDPPV
jgi:hypothetical protein